ncbi:MAG: type II toxin-antitoxin system VapC family toxin [Proteobacteria bacterium]|nr:type II toxin-antitoxin system VapC family toxin [Pseudomonadota bacterium]
MKVFLDSNIPMYAAGGDHPSKGPSLELLRRVASGQEDAVADVEVFQEILHRFSSIGRIAEGFELFDAFGKVVGDILPVEYEDVVAARELLEEKPTINARDAIHVAIMRRNKITTIYSYDRHFDQIEDIDRREP